MDPEGANSASSRLASENDRLKNDLDKSIVENRQLSRQLESWKRQLAEFDVREGGGTTASEVSGDYFFDEDEDALRAKLDEAFRSVGALRLRVEELTLEVTKVIYSLCQLMY